MFIVYIFAMHHAIDRVCRLGWYYGVMLRRLIVVIIDFHFRSSLLMKCVISTQPRDRASCALHYFRKRQHEQLLSSVGVRASVMVICTAELLDGERPLQQRNRSWRPWSPLQERRLGGAHAHLKTVIR